MDDIERGWDTGNNKDNAFSGKPDDVGLASISPSIFKNLNSRVNIYHGYDDQGFGVGGHDLEELDFMHDLDNNLF
jgi:hypothetical protein